MMLSLLNPIFAVSGILIIAVAATVLGRIIPFYRKELQVEGSSRLTPLDGLRGILCFAVLYHHAAFTYFYNSTHKWEPPPSNFYALIGPHSVRLFFCITAFLFWSRVLGIDGKLEVLPFLRARWYRLVPLYLFAVLFALGVAAPYLDWTDGFMYRDLFCTLGMSGIYPPIMLGVYDFGLVLARAPWSLQHEWGFYFVLVALAPLARTGSDRRVFWLLAGLYVIIGHSFDDYFAVGILAAYVARSEKYVTLLRSWVGSLIVIGATGLVFALPHLNRYLDIFIRPLPAQLIPLFAPELLLITAIFIPLACGCSLFGVLNRSGFRLMGMVSYSVYLLHGVFLFAARSAFARYVPHYRHQSEVFWLMVLVLALAVLILSLATYRWIEHAYIQWEKRTRSGPGTASVVQRVLSSLRQRTAADDTVR